LLVAQCSGGSSSGPDAPRTGIGPAGGTVRSADGIVTLEVPAGALGAVTPVEIQPIANTAPGGLGNAFRLLPAGTTFSSPVQLTFALDPADLHGTTFDAIGVGFVGADGRWRSVNDVTRTTSAVSVRTTHFSDWSRLIGWQLRPPEKRVRSGEAVTLKVVDCEPTEDDDGLTSLVPDCDSDDFVAPLVVLSGWAVDGIPGGNLAVGTLTADDDTAVYRAPIVVAEETHAVSVEFTPPNSRPKVLLVSNITVTDVSEFTIVGDLTAPGTSYLCYGLASTSWMKDGVRLTVSENADGTWSATSIVNQPTDYDRGVQPLPPARSVQIDADPDLFDVTSVGVEPAGASAPLINVFMFGTRRTEACTAAIVNGSTVNVPAQTLPDQEVFTFDSRKPSETIGTQGLGWYFEVHRR
jgi:hypothetical protein